MKDENKKENLFIYKYRFNIYIYITLLIDYYVN